RRARPLPHIRALFGNHRPDVRATRVSPSAPGSPQTEDLRGAAPWWGRRRARVGGRGDAPRGAIVDGAAVHAARPGRRGRREAALKDSDRQGTRLSSSHEITTYAAFRT